MNKLKSMTIRMGKKLPIPGQQFSNQEVCVEAEYELPVQWSVAEINSFIQDQKLWLEHQVDLSMGLSPDAIQVNADDHPERGDAFDILDQVTQPESPEALIGKAQELGLAIAKRDKVKLGGNRQYENIYRIIGNVAGRSCRVQEVPHNKLPDLVEKLSKELCLP